MRVLYWLRKRWLESLLVLLLLGVLGYFGWLAQGLVPELPTPEPKSFSGERAYAHLLAQMEFGPRPTGSPGAAQARDYIMAELDAQGWTVLTQTFTYRGVQVVNVVGYAGEGPVALLGAHYDTRRRAELDPDPSRQQEPVPGANDGASGVAVLLELAHALDLAALEHQVWLVFFDAEDNGGLDGWDWVVGSTHMANRWAAGLPPGWDAQDISGSGVTVTPMPSFVIVVDMVGDSDLQIYRESTSSPELTQALWSLAAELGYGAAFVDEERWALTDDHTPFLEQGIQAAVIVDFDYAHWHTSRDTADKTSPESLERVGRLLKAFLEGKQR